MTHHIANEGPSECDVNLIRSARWPRSQPRLQILPPLTQMTSRRCMPMNLRPPQQGPLLLQHPLLLPLKTQCRGSGAASSGLRRRDL